jgi:hypothetical protein
MKNIKSSDIQSPLNDQEKGVGFVLVKNAVMKNAKGNYHSFSKERAASTSDGSNFFIFLGIAIFLILMNHGSEIMDNLNSKQKRTMSDVLQNVQVAKKWDPSINRVERWEQHLAKNPLVLKKFVPDNDSQLLNQNNDSQLLNQIKIIQQQLEDQENTLDFLDIQARARRNMMIGRTILRLNQAGAFNFLN